MLTPNNLGYFVEVPKACQCKVFQGFRLLLKIKMDLHSLCVIIILDSRPLSHTHSLVRSFHFCRFTKVFYFHYLSFLGTIFFKFLMLTNAVNLSLTHSLLAHHHLILFCAHFQVLFLPLNFTHTFCHT